MLADPIQIHQVIMNLTTGTGVHVYLPIIETSSKSQEKHLEEPTQGNGERILLVDDEETIVKVEKQLLERLGYRVTPLTSSTEALNLFKANPDDFDLLITDMTMPQITGTQLADSVKTVRANFPVIICTGFSDQISQETYKEIGIQGFVVKPVIRKEITQVIRKVLDTK